MRFSRRIDCRIRVAPSLLVFFLISLQYASARRLPGHPHSEETQEEDEEQAVSSLSDVWLMMGIAFGWAFFIMRSLLQPKLERYAKTGVVVKGNVREAKVETAASIPEYCAIIDYSYNDLQGNAFQIRKAFATSELLQLGFANVSIVLIPNEPTSGLILKDWARAYRREKKDAASQRTMLCLSLGLGGAFVGLSIVGAIHAVLQLPEENQTTGWICLGCAIALLGPVSYFVFRYWRRCVQATMGSIESGQIVRGTAPADPNWLPQCVGEDVCGTLDCTNPKQRALEGDDESDSVVASRRLVDDTTEAESKFYFVCMPHCDPLKRTQGSASTMSSVSMTSLQIKQGVGSSMIYQGK